MDTLLRSHAPRSVLLVRLMVGGIFLSEGIQKFLDPAARGAGPWSLDHRLAARREP